MRNLLIAMVMALAVLGCGAKGPEGTWTGSITLDRSQFPAATTDAERKAMEDYVNQVQSSKFKLTLSPDKKFKLEAGAKSTTTGTWSQTNKEVTLTPSGTGPQAKPMVFTINDKGDSMVMVELGSPMSVTLTKG